MACNACRTNRSAQGRGLSIPPSNTHPRPYITTAQNQRDVEDAVPYKPKQASLRGSPVYIRPKNAQKIEPKLVG